MSGSRLLLLIISLLLINITIFSQSTSSPYSVFGIGQISGTGFGVNKAMGGTGIALKSGMYLNNINPASYTYIDSLSFIFEIGAFIKSIKYKTDFNNAAKTDANLSYLALVFRLNQWWAVSAGIAPVSSIGYNIKTTSTIEGTRENYTRTYTGSGGINQFYIGNGIRISNGLSAGINFTYLFGPIEQTELIDLGSRFSEYMIRYKYHVNAFRLNYGLQYSVNFGDWEYTMGLIYGNSKKLNTYREAYLSYDLDSVELELENGKTTFNIPQNIGIGFSVAFKDNLRAGIDVEKAYWSDINFSNPLLDTRNSERYSAGIEYKPQGKTRDRGLKVCYYRFGMNYQKSYLIVDDTPLNSMAVTMGMGIPLKRNQNMINLSLEYGTNGTTSNKLIHENYWMFRLNFTLHDKWFQKAKYE